MLLNCLSKSGNKLRNITGIVGGGFFLFYKKTQELSSFPSPLAVFLHVRVLIQNRALQAHHPLSCLPSTPEAEDSVQTALQHPSWLQHSPAEARSAGHMLGSWQGTALPRAAWEFAGGLSNNEMQDHQSCSWN